VSLCAATTRGGAPCTVSVEAGQTFCHHHDPARAEERRRAASRAGKSKPSRELFGIKEQLEKLTEKVLSGEIATNVAAVANQLINTRLRAMEFERKLKETEELEERMEVLERAAEGGDDGWGA
jgi:hypothetical protein